MITPPAGALLHQRAGTGHPGAGRPKRLPAALGTTAIVLAGIAILLVATGGTKASAAGGAAAPERFLVANNDTSVPFPPSTVSFYPIRGDGSLAPPLRVSTAGNGVAGGYFGAERVIVTGNAQGWCIFASNAQSESIAAFDGVTRKLTGVFSGSHDDTRLARDGIGLAAGAGRLYATFSGAGNIGAFEIGAGCALRFVGDVAARGLSGGVTQGLAVKGNMMVVGYGDGSIESFDLSGQLPISHHDAVYSAGRDDDFVPGAVDMTRNGHFAIFGGGSTAARVQVADLSSGKLGATTRFDLGSGWNSGSVRLSPDESVLYVSNSSGGRISAAIFNPASGQVRPGCTSEPLAGFYTKFTYVGAVATQTSEGTGGLLYVPEFDASGHSSIAIVRFSVAGAGCTLRETSLSPVQAGPDSALLSLAVYPPRKE